MTIYLIRHGQTRGNLERRYMGVTDQPLCPQGRAALADWRGPEAEAVYVSPLLRCRETAAILYPGTAQTAVPGLRETDFGAFEGRTYEELQDSPAYRAWLDSAGQAAPPGGESREQVRRRVLAAFRTVTAGHAPGERLALVVHGGTIMTLLEALEPGGQFYRWQAPNGGGFRCRWDGGVLTAEAVLSAGGETPVL